MEEKFFFEIYCDGVSGRFAVRGRKRLEERRAIFAQILGKDWVRTAASLPEGDPGRDFYLLDAEQFKTYNRLVKELYNANRKAASGS